ncbi:adenosylcobalamin-dependent ribonucleoside-diphosphate reductase [Candidatus Daviesbacteria bacterium]|nr:adenosylcobalamin-dependent ribonucleoside-diphosphate reductase [Candidatus Daviesbacteria bacterium]
MKKINRKLTKKQETTLQIISLPKAGRPNKTNGEYKSNGEAKAFDINSRKFETRFIPRYKKIPDMPQGLPQPSFSQSSNKILQERYLLKGGNLEVVETVAERFWHIAYDIASADLDFKSKEKDVQTLAKSFYEIMVRQEFLPNSPTIMNAGKQNGLQYSACFVLPIGDSLPEIFDSVKYAALIHQTGGGCISSDARVWSTFCGIEPIETLFARATADGRQGIRQGSGVAYDVSDLNIKTVAMNPQTAEVGLKEVSHVWQFDVPADQQILVITYQGTQVQTSLWHPFIVIRGTKLIKMRADQLVKGDVILGPDKAATYWPWQDFRNVGSLAIDENLGWLIGFTLGDGSFGYVKSLRQFRVRWFSGTEDVLKKVQNVLLQRNIKVSIQKDKRGLLSVATLNQRFVHDLLEVCGLEKFGPKDNLIRIPEIITKSPLSVVKAFLAGLLDSDGYVAPDGSPSYCTVSEAMSQDLAAMVSLLGFNPSVKSKEPYGNGKQRIYSVQVCTLPQVNRLADELKHYLANGMRLSRLKSVSRKQSALPLEFRSWRDLLLSFGLVHTRSNHVGSGPLHKELNYWSAHGRIDRDSILAIADKVAFFDKNISLLLRRIADNGHEIKNIRKAPTAKCFYDLSVKDWNTYAAGSSGMVMIHNTGFAFSRLRPGGSIVNTTGGVASGPVSFLRVFNAATESIKQGGTRRGANMGILRVDHPDILEFIRCKAELDDLNKPVFEAVSPLLPDDSTRSYFKTLLLDKQIANFNISVAITNKFMDALAKGEDFELISPSSGEVAGRLNAQAVFDEIVERAWNTGDPGLIFIDRINDSPANPVPSLETIESTNPCGEQPLAPWDACNLGSINLGKFVRQLADGQSDVDWEKLRNVTTLAVHFLDNVVQTNPFTLEQIYDQVHKNRRVGLGVMGWADMLFKLKIPYNCDQALELAEKLMQFINDEGHKESEKLAEVRGVFPNWVNSIYADKDSSAFKSRPTSYAYNPGRPIRNATITTIAPTGTISIIGDCSSGIEPVFALAYIHRAKKAGDEMRYLTIANKTFTEIAKREDFYSDDLAQKVMDHGSVSGLESVPEQWQKVFVTASEIDPVWHVKMQAAFQHFTDNGVSKTINMPNSATREDVKNAYMLAWEAGCNGITIYRDGSKTTQVLNVSSTLKTQAVSDEEQTVPVAERPMILRGRTYKVSTPVGEAFITVNRDEQDQPFEVFVTVGRAGMHTMADAEAMGRLVSLSLRLARGTKETDPKAVAQKIVGQLKGIGGASSVGFGKNRVMSLADAIAKVLAEDLSQTNLQQSAETLPLNLTNGVSDQELLDPQPTTQNLQPNTNADLCPECGAASFVMEEGCKKCHSCGYSMC